MADGRGILGATRAKIADFIRGPREPSADELHARSLAAREAGDKNALAKYETDLQLQYLTSIGVDFSPADIRNLQIRGRWGDGRWLYSLYDQMPRLGPGPQIRKMIEAIRDTEDQYKTTPEDADPENPGEEMTAAEAKIAVEARDYIEEALTPWAGEIKAHMATAELYGLAAGEIITDPRGMKWGKERKEKIIDFRPIPARRFRLDPGSHEWLLCLSPLSMEGIPVGPLVQRGKLLFYEIGAGVDPLDQRGLYFQALLPWAIMQYCVRWRAKRVEKYGVPPAIGKVNLADAKQKEQLRQALDNFGATLSMIIGKDSSVEFAGAMAQGRIDPQAEQIEWCSRQFDLIFLGDTQASQVQVGAGSKQSKEQAVQGFVDLTNARALRLNTNVFNRQLIPGLIVRNFGEDVASLNCPTVESSVEQTDDAAALAGAAVQVAQAGFGQKIDGEDLIRRCTLQVASEEQQQEAAQQALAKAQAAMAATPFGGGKKPGAPGEEQGGEEKKPALRLLPGGEKAAEPEEKKAKKEEAAPKKPVAKVLHVGRRFVEGDEQTFAGWEDQPRDEHNQKWVKEGGGESGGSGVKDTAVHQPGIDLGAEGYDEGVDWKQPLDPGGRPIPIKVATVEEAIPLVLEGKVVELPEIRHVNTLVDKLAQMAKEAEALGKAAPNYNLCNVTVSGTSLFCTEAIRTVNRPKGIERIEMPQLAGEPVPGSPASRLPFTPGTQEVNAGEKFTDFLQAIGIKATEERVLAASLKASQNELVGQKVAGIMRSAATNRTIIDTPIFISRDNYIVDGHHRWAAVVGLDTAKNTFTTKMNVIRIDAPVTEVLRLAEAFAKRFGIKQSGWHPPKGQKKFAAMGDLQPAADAALVRRTKRTREMQLAIAAKVRAHLKAVHKRALAEGEKALAARAASS